MTATGPRQPTIPADLLERMRSLQVAANRAEMARARAAAELCQHFRADIEVRRAADPHQTLAPLDETVVETQPVTGQSASRIRTEVEQVLLLDRHLPWLGSHLDAGRLDLFRVRPVTDAMREDLAEHAEARARFAGLVRRWFDRAVADSPVLVNRTYAQIRNHVHYLVTKVLASELDDRFVRRHRQRTVSTYPTGDGMAALVVDADVVSVARAAHHLDLLARDARSTGDPRSLDQLRSDLAITLLSGSAEAVPPAAPDGEVGRWARPIINVTVPVETLMGLCDEPGRMGTTTLPASLVRHVAGQPGSTWHRLLTDPARGAVELSTERYRPTGPIWREVVAAQPTCFAPTCERPATDCDLDHRRRWPEGPTSTANLGPACRRHHRAKHSPGARLVTGPDGILRFTTRAGLTHALSPAEQPTCDDPAVTAGWESLLEIQPNRAELVEAVDSIRQHRHWTRISHAEAERHGAPDHGWWDVPPAEEDLSTLTG